MLARAEQTFIDGSRLLCDRARPGNFYWRQQRRVFGPKTPARAPPPAPSKLYSAVALSFIGTQERLCTKSASRFPLLCLRAIFVEQ